MTHRERMYYFMFINLLKGAREWGTGFPQMVIKGEVITAWTEIKLRLGRMLDIIEGNIPSDLKAKFDDDSEKFCNILEAIRTKCKDINEASRAIDLIDLYLHKRARFITEERFEEIAPVLTLWDGLSDEDKVLALKYLTKKQKKDAK